MFKKFLSWLSVAATVLTMVPSQAIAADANVEDPDDLITEIVKSVGSFNPNANESITFDVTFNDADPLLATASSGVYAIKNVNDVDAPLIYLEKWGELADGANQGDTEAIPTTSIDWNGQDGCPNGGCELNAQYQFIVDVKFTDGNGAAKSGRQMTPFFFDNTLTIYDAQRSGLVIDPRSNNAAQRDFKIDYKVSKDSLLTVEVRKDGNMVKNLITNSPQAAGEASSVTWNGLDNAGEIVANGTYTVRLLPREDLDTPVVNESILSFNVDVDSNAIVDFAVDRFEVSPSVVGDNLLDPSPEGNNERLKIDYSLNENPTSVIFEIRDNDDELLKTEITDNLQTTIINDAWDGKYANRLVVPGVYTVRMIATNADGDRITEDREITVAYGSIEKPDVTNFSVSPNDFDPDNEDTSITFETGNVANLRVTIENQDGTIIKEFTDYNGDEYGARTHDISWDGSATNGNSINRGDYIVVLEATNEYGVVVESASVKVSDLVNDLKTSNAHLDNISCSPSGDVEPDQEDILECEADVEKDGVDLQVFAVRGNTEIELYDENDLDEGRNVVEFDWDLTDDDDEYVDAGVWRIEFRTRLDGAELLAGLTREIVYEKPEIDELYVSKDEIDNDLDEFTYVMFKLKDDAEVSLYYLVDGQRDDEIVEELDVEADKWYAYEIDGNGLDYDDSIDIELVAANTANENVNSSRRVSFDVDEDDVSSSKVNVTNDYITPVVTDCEGATLEIGFELEDDAEVDITIHRGKTSSGSSIATLLDGADLEAGNNSITWDCRDKNGNELSNGFYTYEITSRDRSTESEEGLFIVASSSDIGDIDGASSSSSSSNNDGVNSNVTINGGSNNDNNDGGSVVVDDCAGFSDIMETDSRCEAIEWAKNAGIFEGYPNGTFGADRNINRVELLKVILEANNINASSTPSGNLGFRDVTVGEWYMRYIARAMELGIFKGDDGANTARPGDNVNRVESLKIVFEAIRVVSGYTTQSCTPGYNDTPGNEWYSKYVCESEDYGLFTDTPGNQFLPSKAATRGEIVEMLYKLEEVGLF